jgi:hypothetical protein
MNDHRHTNTHLLAFASQVTHCACSFGFKGVIDNENSICEALYKFLPDTLIHYWPFDGNVRDYTDRKAHMTIKGQVVLTSTGGPYQNLKALGKQFGNNGFVSFGEILGPNATIVRRGRASGGSNASAFEPPKYLELDNFKAPRSKKGDFTVWVKICLFFPSFLVYVLCDLFGDS